MFKRNKHKKLDPRVRYQAPQFKKSLGRARGFKRIGNPFAGTTFGVVFSFLRRLDWKIMGGTVIGVAALIYLLFIPNFLFVKNIQITGVGGDIATDVQQQVNRYLDDGSFLYPRRNMFFVSTKGISDYVATANVRVWKIDAVEKDWPATVVVHVAAREATYVLKVGEQETIVANDGSVLPASDPVDKAKLLVVTGEGRSVPGVGQNVFSGDLLSSLTAITSDFVRLVELPLPEKVEMVPIVVKDELVPSPTPSSILGGTGAPGPTSILETNIIAENPTTPITGRTRILDVSPQDLRLHMAAYAPLGAPAFTILIPVNTQTIEVLEKLHLLLSKQSPDRLRQLSYVDLRFPGRAFICLRNTPCASTADSGE